MSIKAVKQAINEQWQAMINSCRVEGFLIPNNLDCVDCDE